MAPAPPLLPSLRRTSVRRSLASRGLSPAGTSRPAPGRGVRKLPEEVYGNFRKEPGPSVRELELGSGWRGQAGRRPAGSGEGPPRGPRAGRGRSVYTARLGRPERGSAGLARVAAPSSPGCLPQARRRKTPPDLVKVRLQNQNVPTAARPEPPVSPRAGRRRAARPLGVSAVFWEGTAPTCDEPRSVSQGEPSIRKEGRRPPRAQRPPPQPGARRGRGPAAPRAGTTPRASPSHSSHRLSRRGPWTAEGTPEPNSRRLPAPALPFPAWETAFPQLSSKEAVFVVVPGFSWRKNRCCGVASVSPSKLSCLELAV